MRSLATLTAARQDLAVASAAKAVYLKQHHDIRSTRYPGIGVVVRVGASHLLPRLSSLESAERTAAKTFWEAQADFAACKKAAGLSSY
jgi:hypothetical protein